MDEHLLTVRNKSSAHTREGSGLSSLRKTVKQLTYNLGNIVHLFDHADNIVLPQLASQNKSTIKRQESVEGGLNKLRVTTRRIVTDKVVLGNVLKQQMERYPPSALDNPYIREPSDPIYLHLAADNITPLHLSALAGNEELLQYHIRFHDINCVDKDGKTAVIYSVIGNQLRCLEILKNHHAKLDLSDENGRTAIHWAVYYERLDMLKKLIKWGANADIRDKEGRSALHIAAANEQPHCLKYLLGHATQFKLSEPDNELMTVLLWAVFYNKVENLKLILEKKGKGSRLSESDTEMKTALIWCSIHKHDVKCAKLLLSHDPMIIDSQDINGRTALHHAILENNVVLISFLATHPLISINKVDYLSRSALHYAALTSIFALIPLLLAAGSDSSLKDYPLQATPLHYACSKNQSQAVNLLTGADGKGKVKEEAVSNWAYLPDREGRYPLVWACTKGHVQTVTILLDRGVNPDYVDLQGATALHAAAEANQAYCVSLLLEHGAKHDIKDHFGQTALYRTIERGYADIATILINAGASRTISSIRDNEQRSPLHYAAMFHHLPIVSLLLSFAVDINQPDMNGRTALHIAAMNGHNEIVKYLIENGANLNKPDNEGVSVLHYCVLEGQTTALELLLVAGCNPNPTSFDYTLPTPLDFAISNKKQDCINILLQHGGRNLQAHLKLSSTKIQKVFRGYLTRKIYRHVLQQRLSILSLSRSNSAIKIQRAFRFFRAIKAFKIKYKKSSFPVDGAPNLFSMDEDELSYFIDQQVQRQEEDKTMLKNKGLSGSNNRIALKTTSVTVFPKPSDLPNGNREEGPKLKITYEDAQELEISMTEDELAFFKENSVTESVSRKSSIRSNTAGSSDPVKLKPNEDYLVPPPEFSLRQELPTTENDIKSQLAQLDEYEAYIIRARRRLLKGLEDISRTNS